MIFDRGEQVVHLFIVYFGVGEPDCVFVIAVQFEHGGVDIYITDRGRVVKVLAQDLCKSWFWSELGWVGIGWVCEFDSVETDRAVL
jgi:hypothetical protein